MGVTENGGERCGVWKREKEKMESRMLPSPVICTSSLGKILLTEIGGRWNEHLHNVMIYLPV